MSMDFEEDEWVTPADWQAGAVASATPSGLAASVFMPSAPLSDDEEDEEEEEEDAADDSNLEEIGDSDGLGDTDVETDGEWAESSNWSFPAASVAEALTLVASRPPSEAEEASVRSSLFIDVARSSHRCGVTSFEISTPMEQDEPPEATWNSGESEQVPRMPLVFDISALNGEDPQEPSVAAAASSAPEDQERRLLCDVLWASQPEWGPADLVAAERKLAKAGVDSVAGLVAALRIDLDRHLAQVGKHGTLNIKAIKGPKEPRAGAVWGFGGKGRGMECPRMGQGRLLCDMLWKSRPTWTPAMLDAAQRKLAMVGIHDLASLDRALSGGLNRRLRKAGVKTFSADTIVALRRHMDAFFDRLGIEDKETAWMSSSGHRLCTSEAIMHGAWMELSLRDVLWQSRPMWSALDLSAAERKLALIGINSVASLAGALAGDLNKQLRASGLKAFNRETVRELRRRLGVSSSAKRGAVKAMSPK